MSVHPFRHWLTVFAVMPGRPAASVVIGVYAAAWFTLDSRFLDWLSAATLAMWFMTLVIQRTAQRDTQALCAPLSMRCDGH
jgi:hypothetical protein